MSQAFRSTLTVRAIRPGSGAGRDGRPELADVGRLLRRGLRRMVAAARADEAGPGRVLREHLGAAGDVAEGVVQESWPAYEQVNVQSGLDHWLAAGGRRHRLLGLTGFQHREFGLAELLVDGPGTGGLDLGAVARTNVAAGPDDAVLACVRCGLYLVEDGAHRLVLLLRVGDRHTDAPGPVVEIAGTDHDRVRAVAGELRDSVLAHNVFRGQVLSFGGEMFHRAEALLHFLPRPAMTGDRLVLPAGVLEAVDRQVVGVARHREALLAAGQHLKRGLLLYGPPGVGKTHTVRYLSASSPGTTVIHLTGQALGLIAEACSVARALTLSMLVVEDVDLIAEDRVRRPGQHPLLFQLLNEMDGLDEDADVVFVLTTNRADLLEPALAARPGRIDQAIELTLPDAAGRRALFELYRGALVVDTARLDAVVAATEGVTASFLKELLRRAAVLAAEHAAGDGPLAVSADDLDAALAELLDTRNAMTRSLLGAGRPPWSGDPEV